MNDTANATVTIDTTNLVSVREFEQQVQDLEGVTLIVRLPARTLVKPYPFTRRAPNTSVKTWAMHRVIPCLGKDVEYVILSEGERVNPHGMLNRARLT